MMSVFTKVLTTVFTCLLFTKALYAQTEVKRVNNTAGQQGNGYYTVSFGEPVVGTTAQSSTGFLAPNDTLTVTSTGNLPVANAYVNIFPNPVTSVLTIQSAEVISKITIYTTSGQVVQTNDKTSSSTTTINMSDFSSGTYLLQIVYEKAIVPTVARIIKN